MNDSPASLSSPTHPRDTRERTCGAMCATYAEGHELHAIRRAAASATSSQWQDALVSSVSPDGAIVVAGVFSDIVATLWHHRDLTAELRVGEAVSYHPRYGVLATAQQWLSVATVADRAVVN